MTSGCGFKCAKATLFGFNFIFWVVALAVLGAGVWMRMDPTFLDKQGVAKLESDAISLSSGGLILIAVAAVAVVLGFFGCCGTAKESRCMLGIYVTFLLIILFVQLVVAICGIFALTVMKDEFEQKIRNSMTSKIYNDYGSEKTVTEMWDYTQWQGNCCGAKGPIDYKNSTWYKERTNTSLTVPLSCCHSDPDKVPNDEARCQEEAQKIFNNTGTVTDDGQGLHTKGCYASIKLAMRKYSKVLIGISLGVAIIELFCFVLGVFICCNVGKYSYDYE